MSFSVGDEVVCVDARDGKKAHPHLERGRVYRVVCVESCCGATVVRLAELQRPMCPVCSSKPSHYYAWRFVKLPREKVEGTEPEAMPIVAEVE